MEKNVYFLLLLSVILTFLVPFSAFASPEVNKNTDCTPMVNIDVTVNTENHSLYGTVSMELPRGKTIHIQLNGARLGRITLEGEIINPVVKKDTFSITAADRKSLLSIQFSKIFSPFGVETNFIDNTGIVLLQSWCPILKELACYRLKAKVRNDFTAISEADNIKVLSANKMSTYMFEFPYPRSSLSLIAGPYQVSLKHHRDIEIAAYFFPEDEKLIPKYINRSMQYIDLYEDLLGPYPFKRFAIVENRAPTGYGLPTYTLLGQEVARLPFIVDTSLGHEILHSWFGNSVYVYMPEGNWSEGLTTYLADFMYAEQKDQGEDYRHRLLTDYQSYVHEKQSMSLAEFKYRIDRSSKAVGYGKGAMLFHMLKQEIGKEAFNKALKRFVLDYRFKIAGWSDLEALFSDTGGKDLSVFFDQWLNRKDVPKLTISKGNINYLDGGYQSQNLIIQQNQKRPYCLQVPLVLETTSGQIKRNVQVKNEKEPFEIKIEGQLLGVTLDPDYDMMRYLTPSEFPPVLSRLFGSNNKLFIPPAQHSEIYCEFTAFLKSMGFEEKNVASLADSELKKSDLLILGDPASKLERLAGQTPELDRGVIVTVKENAINTAGVVAVIKASSSRELELIQRKLIHYGQYSTLRFQNGKLMQKNISPTQKGIHLSIQNEITGIAAADLFPMDNIINEISEKRVIYIGEYHDHFGHHMAQLRIIQGLDRLNRRFAVGMEMFQRPFQDVLNRYLNGQIDERTFLKESEYLKRWKYDYHLYRPIIEYCKGHSIPILALNLPSEISKKVARKGFKSLSNEELEQVPLDIDGSNTAYKLRLKQIFVEHPESEIKNFDDFYQAQIFWDETMAQCIHDYLVHNPNRQMVVLAGAGHIAFGDGIPSRTFRRGKYDQSIIINVRGTNLEQDMADFFLFPVNLQPPFSAKLGVIVNDDNGEVDGIMLKSVMPNSVAHKSGLRSGDQILSFDRVPINDIYDLKIALLFKKEGETAIIRVKKTKRLAPDKVFDLMVGPFRNMEMPSHHTIKSKK